MANLDFSHPVDIYMDKGKKVKVVNLYSASSRACARL